MIDVAAVSSGGETLSEIIQHTYHIGILEQMLLLIILSPLILMALLGFPGVMAGVLCYTELHWSLTASVAAGFTVMMVWFLFLVIEGLGPSSSTG